MAETPSLLAERPRPTLHPLLGCAMAALLVGVCIASGSAMLDAPWILGDEYIFIVRNPDVTGEGVNKPLMTRWAEIFAHMHEDLYQPITILSYAIEWTVWSGDNGAHRVFFMRLTDVLIHALNACLAWLALSRLLRTYQPSAPAGIAWALALVWAAHPMLVGTYVADMGRTHLLSATFVLLSLLARLRALRAGGEGWFLVAWVALLAAMLNKPVVGWVAVTLALEWSIIGLRATLRSPRIYLDALMCVFFAALTLFSTRETLLLEDSPLPLFGDPLTRAALSFFFYLRNMLVPGPWLAAWYPPDIHTGWSNPAVWASLGLLALCMVAIALAARRRETRAVSVGLTWMLAVWLPVSGIVGARVLAAQDRYFYLPMLGLLAAIGVGLARIPGRRSAAVVAIAAIALAGVALPFNQRICAVSRSALQRALSSVRFAPEDPRVFEAIAAACNFGRGHDTPEAHLEPAPDWTGMMSDAIAEATRLAAAHPEYFPDANSRAAFHRRLSFALWSAGRFEESLAQAQLAREFEPDAKLSWLRLAHAYRALNRNEDAREAFAQLERVLPADAPDRAIRLLEFADLLMGRFGDAAGAMERYREAMRTPTAPADVRALATVELARCEVLAGQGAVGFQLASGVLKIDPTNLEALSVVALYHLRSEHFEQAYEAYAQLLASRPTDYEALRGFHEACARLGAWRDADAAWRNAIELAPDNPAFRGFSAWAAACGAAPSAAERAEALLKAGGADQFAHLCKMLIATRAGQIETALAEIQAAESAPSLPGAQELPRAELTIRRMIEQQRLPAEAAIVRAALWKAMGSETGAAPILDAYLATDPPAELRAIAERVRNDSTSSAPSQ